MRVELGGRGGDARVGCVGSETSAWVRGPGRVDATTRPWVAERRRRRWRLGARRFFFRPEGGRTAPDGSPPPAQSPSARPLGWRDGDGRSPGCGMTSGSKATSRWRVSRDPNQLPRGHVHPQGARAERGAWRTVLLLFTRAERARRLASRGDGRAIRRPSSQQSPPRAIPLKPPPSFTPPSQDDAGARCVRVCLDERSHGVSSLAYAKLAGFQGASLLVHNDSVFRESDFESISRIGDSVKRTQRGRRRALRRGVQLRVPPHGHARVRQRAARRVLRPALRVPPERQREQPGQAHRFRQERRPHRAPRPVRTLPRVRVRHARGVPRHDLPVPASTPEQASLSKPSKASYDANGVRALLAEFVKEAALGRVVSLLELLDVLEWAPGDAEPKLVARTALHSPTAALRSTGRRSRAVCDRVRGRRTDRTADRLRGARSSRRTRRVAPRATVERSGGTAPRGRTFAADVPRVVGAREPRAGRARADRAGEVRDEARPVGLRRGRDWRLRGDEGAPGAARFVFFRSPRARASPCT